MTGVEGVYDCVIKSPLGDQETVLTLDCGVNGYSGTATTPMGDMTVTDVRVDGKEVAWTMKLGLPMPMTLRGEAVIAEGRVTGSLTAGSFGTMALIGTRRN